MNDEEFAELFAKRYPGRFMVNIRFLESAQNESASLKAMVNDVRQERDSYKALAQRLALTLQEHECSDDDGCHGGGETCDRPVALTEAREMGLL